jgi:3-hydroxyisobutyrate dehydrogenase-like beta-hydroxyacid dehydrogenase
MKIGILHPGEMGASVGATARAAGNAVSWASAGRSEATRRRAEESGLEDAGTVEALIAGSEIIVSVCPPEAARTLAASVIDAGFIGIYVDANAVSTVTARTVAGVVEDAGAHFVDGGIIGPPVHQEGTTRLYLSGAEASTVASAFKGSMLETLVIGDRPGSASALKMCYAAWTKGSAALLAAIRALAVAEDVESALLEEWNISQHGLEARSAAGARNNAFKAWRFAGEMREIAATFEASGLPGGFHRGAEDVYTRLAAYKDCDPPPELAEIIEKLLDSGA